MTDILEKERDELLAALAQVVRCNLRGEDTIGVLMKCGVYEIWPEDNSQLVELAHKIEAQPLLYPPECFE